MTQFVIRTAKSQTQHSKLSPFYRIQSCRNAFYTLIDNTSPIKKYKISIVRPSCFIIVSTNRKQTKQQKGFDGVKVKQNYENSHKPV